MATALLAAALGCGESSNNNGSSDGGSTGTTPDGGTTTPDGGSTTPDGGTTTADGGTTTTGPERLTAFARNLIETKTSDDSTPAEIASLTFAEDDEDPNTFAPAFFQ
jgi:hypothetical protein